jgi:hypothetical protein
MFTQRYRWTHLLFLVTLFVTLCVAGTLTAGGKKPPKDDPPPPGRIYFGIGGTDADGNPISLAVSMLADGSDVQPSEFSEPSYCLHDGHRWFLDVVRICLEQDAQDN